MLTAKGKGGAKDLFCFNQSNFSSICLKNQSLPKIFFGGGVGDRETCSLRDLPLEFHDLIFFVMRQMALRDQYFLHLADHSSHLGRCLKRHTFLATTPGDSNSARIKWSQRSVFFKKSLQVTYI